MHRHGCMLAISEWVQTTEFVPWTLCQTPGDRSFKRLITLLLCDYYWTWLYSAKTSTETRNLISDSASLFMAHVIQLQPILINLWYLLISKGQLSLPGFLMLVKSSDRFFVWFKLKFLFVVLFRDVHSGAIRITFDLGIHSIKMVFAGVFPIGGLRSVPRRILVFLSL